MATRSRIGVMIDESTCRSVYCHWDGYPSNNGAILQQFYQDPDKVNELIALGDISSLGGEIGERHDFNSRYKDTDPRNNWTVAYSRDRGEKDTNSLLAVSFGQFIDQCEHAGAEWAYIYFNNRWFVVKVYGDDHTIRELDEVLEEDFV